MPVLIAPEAPRSQVSAPRELRRSFWEELFAWRSTQAFGKIEAVVLAVYCALLAIAIPFHEPWGDEAQAWLVARDNSLWQIIRFRLHYEGSPALWHVLLHGFQLAGGRYGAMNWFGAIFAVAGAYALLRWSPFPLIVRCLLPFTFYFAYQYAVVARSYVLFGLLVFAVCALYGRRDKLLLFAAAAGLLANLSLQGFIFSCLVSMLYLWDLYREREERSLPLGSLKRAALIFVPMAALAAYSALPAPDVDFIGAGATSDGIIHSIAEKWVGYTPAQYASDVPPDPWHAPEPEYSKPGSTASPAQWLAWYIDHRPVINSRGDRGPETFVQHRLEDFFSVLSQATASVSSSNLISCSFLGFVVLWLWRSRGLRMLLPWGVLLIVGQILWTTDHHIGMFFIVLLAGLWIGYTQNPTARRPLWMERSLLMLFVAVAVGQIAWTAYAVDHDIRGQYDPGKETAAFMKAHPVRKTAAFHYWSVSVEPYFEHNPFYNEPTRYWPWAWFSEPDPYYRTVVADHPDRIVYSVEVSGPGQMRNQWVPMGRVTTAAEARTLPWDYMFKYLHEHGYVETHRFCGTRFSRFGFSHRACDIILEPIGPDPLQMENAKYADPDDSE